MSTPLFSNILIAYDGSDGSNDALQKAENLTKQNDAHLTVVYAMEYEPTRPLTQEKVTDSLPHNPLIYQTPTTSGSIPLPNETINGEQTFPDDQSDIILSDARVKLSKVLKNLRFERLIGNPAEEICDYAAQNDVDLIVIGNRGLSGIKKLVTGSVSEHVAKKAHCPVLICK